MHFSEAQPKGDVSTLPGWGHFYFALTVGEQGMKSCNVFAKISPRFELVVARTGPTPATVAQLMGKLRQGSQEAGRELVELFYPELRRLAAAKMQGERGAHTWQPTALVNELYLELVRIRALGDRDYGEEEERAAFFALAGQMMKRLLIHHARPLYRRVERVEMEEASQPGASSEALQEVEELLSRLAAVDPKLRTVVEMKVFEGLTRDEIARQLGCSRRTVASDWSFAQQWLRKEWAGRPRP